MSVFPPIGFIRFVILIAMTVVSQARSFQYNGKNLSPLSSGNPASSRNLGTTTLFMSGGSVIRREIEKYKDRVFEDLSTESKDKYLSFNEVYRMVLLLYIQTNRQAPINPPSIKKVRRIFDKADEERDGKISRSEFDTILHLIIPRLSIRVLAHKFISGVVAPLLAFKTVRRYNGKAWVRNVGSVIINHRWCPTSLKEILETETFWTVVLTAAFVSTLAKIVLSCVTSLYDSIVLKLSDDDVSDEALA